MAKLEMKLYHNVRAKLGAMFSAQSDTLSTKWHSLDAREQSMLKFLARFLPVALLLFVFSETWQAQSQAQERLQSEQKLSDDIAAVYTKLSSIQNTDMSASELVEQMTTSSGLSLTQVPVEGKGLQISVTHNDFAVLANLMVNLETQGVRFTQYQISQKTDKSIVLQAMVSKSS